ncbi:MAG: LuxR C-terminal-related transcriptional regulator [Coleofasciculaceae cyanobacterium]
MTNFLQCLFKAIAQSRDEQDLRSRVMKSVGDYFAAHRWGIFFFDRLYLIEPRFQNLLRSGLSVEHNPVLRYLVENHAPVHEALVVSPRAWKMICPRPDHWHVMAGPLVSSGSLVGVVGFTRVRGTPAFSTKDLTDLSALCLHLSTWLATARVQPLSVNVLRCDRLTPREVEIADLVAQGMTNAQIGAALWITENSVKQALKRMFRKLEVTSRAEMVARLSAYHNDFSIQG